MGYPALLTSRKFDLRLAAVKIFHKKAKNPWVIGAFCPDFKKADN